MLATPSDQSFRISADKQVRAWLYFCAFLVFCMVIVGGATRLTDSGLSITEWKPLLGALPPLSAADWQAAFEKYQHIPQYQILNKGMSLEEFKFIYWWEWAHRLLGRLVGVVFLLPFLYFAATGKIERRLWPRLIVLFLLGAGQGALGWYMVASGLVDRVDVSQYRLSAHLSLAALIYAATLWTAMGIGHTRQKLTGAGDWLALGIVALVLLQIAAGGFVAGLDAGFGYSTWPKMDGQWIPGGLDAISPLWRNLFENALTVQFNHRMLAYIIMICVLIYVWLRPVLSSGLLLMAIVLQISLGIMTLLMHVPLSVALIHQAGAMIVLLAALWALNSCITKQHS